MRNYQAVLPWAVLLSCLGKAQAGLDLNSSSNMAVYWGQNSGGKGQQPLAYYCKSELDIIQWIRRQADEELLDDAINVIPLAFDMMIDGPGGAPEVDFSVTSKECDVFPGTQLKNCPQIAKDIKTCQDQGKTILLSIGGATYSEGGFSSEDEAKAGAQLMWETFGPKQDGSDAKRPFGDVALDGFDFDFEANVQNMAPFANELRSLMDAEKDKKYFLTAAPQCPYPDQSDKEILNGPVSIDAVWVQFYNNFCGVNAFSKNTDDSKFNFDQWDNWAKKVSKNKDVKVLLGVPADTTAASSGYIPASKLKDVIEYAKTFDSFGGVMMWDMTQAYANNGFIDDVREALGSGLSSSSSSTSASDSASSSSSTNSPHPSPSSKPPASSSSSSSSSGSGDSSTGAETTTTTTSTTSTSSDEPSATPSDNGEDLPDSTATPTPSSSSESSSSTSSSTPSPAPTSLSTSTTSTSQEPPKPATTTTKPPKPPTTTTTTTPKPPKTTNPPGSNDDKNNDDKSKDDMGLDLIPELLTNNLFSLLSTLRQANGRTEGRHAGGHHHGGHHHRRQFRA
ncbi:hypothetical protein N7474_000277 [Penicillium riverlandense]|uniref:uncharacterized protein n=1 Tax=Penicillium riverlandense TaxID=1903569 RepID=UPI002546CD25|nr:uncharacterized protein N7474_000277 [Penicillium riverlandense]KAJ5831966.1 hypothetical protein N7474_000277 [Penicillium riverlandense]